MTASIKNIEKRMSQLRKEVPTKGFERYPSILNDISNLSAELKSPAVTAAATDKTIQSIIAFPPQIQRGWTYVPKQALLFTPANVIHILASIWPGQEPQVTTLDGSGLLTMNITLILLYGFLEITAEGPNSPTRISVEFNTVAWYQLAKPLRRLLQVTKANLGEPTDKTSYSPTAARALEKLPLKFSNGLKIYGLLPGEELEDMVFQQGTWKRRFMLLRQPVSANTLLLLTSNFVVVIREELGVEQGWVITYIPRKNILGIKNEARDLQNELTMRLKRRDQTAEYKLQLMTEATQDLRARWSERGYSWEE
jgi:hypothetical protein